MPAWGPRICQLLGAAFLIFPAPGCESTQPDGRPNIVLIVVDTLRADHVGIYGHERDTTPHLDDLARRGTYFRRAYAHSSWTLPSMTSLLTGLLPHEHGVGRDPGDAQRFGRLAPEIPTVAEKLAGSGYQVGAIVNNVFLAPEFGLQRGFGNDYNYRGASKYSIRSAEETVDDALSWLEDKSSPYFLLLHFMEPHLFYDPAPHVRGLFTGAEEPPIPIPFGTDESLRKIRGPGNSLNNEELEYLKKLYDEEIFSVDRALGRFFEALEASPQWGETVVIVTADHGEEFFDHGGFEHGHTLYSELTRVPLIVHGPDLARGQVAEVVEHVDVSQGMLALAGISQDGLASGADLFSKIKAGDPPGRGGSIAENTLYGPPRLSYLDGEYRIHLRPGGEFLEIWELDADGLEAKLLRPQDSLELIGRLTKALKARRHNLATAQIAEGPRLSERELSELMALGYIEDPGVDSK